MWQIPRSKKSYKGNCNKYLFVLKDIYFRMMCSFQHLMQVFFIQPSHSFYSSYREWISSLLKNLKIFTTCLKAQKLSLFRDVEVWSTLNCLTLMKILNIFITLKDEWSALNIKIISLARVNLSFRSLLFVMFSVH